MAAATPDVEQLMDQARVKLPGASDAGIKGELFDVFREFFADSSSWTENCTVNVIPDTIVYDVAPSEGQIIRLAGVVDANNFPQPAIMPELGTIQFRSPYNVAQTMTASVVLQSVLPNLKGGFPVVPDWVLPRWGVAILDGLLGKMFGQFGKTYTEPNMSRYHLRRFRDGVTQARVATLRRNTFGTQAWTYPQGYSTRTQRGGISVGDDTRFQ